MAVSRWQCRSTASSCPELLPSCQVSFIINHLYTLNQGPLSPLTVLFDSFAVAYCFLRQLFLEYAMIVAIITLGERCFIG